ncbi:hypothetical protein CPC08DRAFT_49291 [Agrocybe pediades]|nr:hypothetical protein CPC08DRAFT_49291 [Agrocybe pediades]
MVLQEVADLLREHIFAQMPIRMLQIPNMQLVERRAIYQILLPLMEDITEEYLEEKKQTNTLYFLERNRMILDCIKERARYAILSHTWFDSEVTYDDWILKRNLSGPGYDKLERFCEVAAAEHNVSLAWMDTICINKESTAELDESIRSMYRWYEGASTCLIYLANTTSLDDMVHDRWFTRGWTLQELLAPKRLKFYNASWKTMTPPEVENDKPHLSYGEEAAPIHGIIEKATGISPRQIQYFKPGVDADLSQRMIWAAKRSTTRGEDRAYSLMGVFSVSFPLAYGEGAERAFFRLLEQILHSHRSIMDILNWAGRPISYDIHSSRLLPSSSECFLSKAQNIGLDGIRLSPSKPMNLTHLGLRVRLLFVDADTPSFEDSKALLSEGKVKMLCVGSTQDEPTIVHLRNVHDRDLFGPFRFTFKFVFGIWNFHESGKTISIPEICTAFLFRVPHVDASFMAPLDPDEEIDKENMGQPGKLDEEEEEEDLDLQSCIVETSQVISFPSSMKFRNCYRENQLAACKVKLRSVYL